MVSADWLAPTNCCVLLPMRSARTLSSCAARPPSLCRPTIALATSSAFWPAVLACWLSLSDSTTKLALACSIFCCVASDWVCNCSSCLVIFCASSLRRETLRSAAPVVSSCAAVRRCNSPAITSRCASSEVVNERWRSLICVTVSLMFCDCCCRLF